MTPVLLWAAALALADDPTAARAVLLQWPAPTASFGEIYQGVPLEHRFAVRNTSAQTVRFGPIQARRAGADVHAEPQALAPGQSGFIVVRQTTAQAFGWTRFEFAAEAGGALQKLALEAFIQSAFDPPMPRAACASPASSPSGSANNIDLLPLLTLDFGLELRGRMLVEPEEG